MLFWDEACFKQLPALKTVGSVSFRDTSVLHARTRSIQSATSFFWRRRKDFVAAYTSKMVRSSHSNSRTENTSSILIWGAGICW